MDRLDPTGLLASWHLDEGTGTLAKDSSGNGKDITTFYSGVTWHTPGKSGYCLDFDASSNTTRVVSPTITLTDEWSYSLWAYIDTFTSPPANNPVPFYLGEPTNRTFLQFLSTGLVRASWNRPADAAAATADSPAGTVTTGQWYHIAVTHKGNNTYLYVNAVVVGSNTTYPSFNFAAAAVTLGTYGVYDYRFNGKIDEVNSWDRELTAAEVKLLSLYPNGVPPIEPISRKITLVEYDAAMTQTLWFNYTAGVWYVDFDAIYDRIDPAYLVGVSAQPIVKIGSVSQDAVPLALVADIATCITTNNSYYWDATDRRVYVHLNGGSEPSLHAVRLGVTAGVSNQVATYNGIYYEPRLKSAPAISKTKDPLFFGRISFDGGGIGIDNADGVFDGIVVGNPGLFGGAVRIYQGFDTEVLAAFSRMASGIIEGIKIDGNLCTITMVDMRKFLSRNAPRRVFDVGTYPDISYWNLGLPIPLAYGTLKKVPCVCVNEQAAAPGTWDFKICDCTDHAIQSIDQIYSDNVKVTATASSLANGTFSLALADFVVGGKVSADIHGYVDGTPALIQNAADVILDLMLTYLGIPYNSTYFNTDEWDAAQALAMDIGIFVPNAVEVFQIIEDICASSLMNMIPQDDGLFTLRTYDAARAIDQTLYPDEILGTPIIEYDPQQVITSAVVGYSKNWELGSYSRVHDTSQEATIYAIYKMYREREFLTLLVSEADAQTYATAMLALYGSVLTKIRASFKLQPMERELMDFVMLPVYRQGKAMLGMTKCEVYSISKDLLAATVQLGCRVI